MSVVLGDNPNTKHPTWDWIRHSGDREILVALDTVGSEDKQLARPPDDDRIYRPKDVEAFRDAKIAIEPANEARWRELADILHEPRWWLSFSF